jgi:histidinol phosphatase-like enzyme
VIVIGDQSNREHLNLSRKVARAIDARIAAEVEHKGGHIDAFVICPHGLSRRCSCRNPEPGLLIRTARQSPLDLTKAVVISDRPDFLLSAERLGCSTVLVSDQASNNGDDKSIGLARDLRGAVQLILGPASDAKGDAQLRDGESPPLELQSVC